LPLELVEARTGDDGAYDVTVRWTGGAGSFGEARVAVFALLGSIAEPATYVRQRGLAFELVTGFLDGDSAFEPHGHAIRVSVLAPDG
jgi:hypothetical protein